MKKKITYNSDEYWLCDCQKCGWIGTSDELAGGGAIGDTGDYDDVYCPICGHIDPDSHESYISYRGVVTVEVDIIEQSILDEIKKGYTYA